jgi:membrane fusion protein (multidrug efflux system)
MADDLRFEPVGEATPLDTFMAEEVEKNKATKMSKKRKVLLLGVGGFLAKLIIGAGIYWAVEGSHYVSTDNAYVGASTAQINSQVSGQVLEVRAEDTDTVHRGDILAIVDPADAELNLARAEADYHRALQRVRQYYAQEAGSAAQVSARQADLTRAETEYDRRRSLASSGAISGEELSATRANYEAARANLTAAQQNLAAQRALTQGATIESHPETASARAALETARLALSRTTIVAPIDGVVAQRNVQVGQRIDPGQSLMVIAPLNEAYVDANFKEGQLEHVRIGQPVTLTSDLYGDDVEYHGHVAGLGGGTGSAFAVIPAQNATGNWIKVVQRVPVRVSLDPAELAEHPLRVGLSMEARIDTREPDQRTASHH